jgi:GNAT superfamily N-acetyltransferase
MDTNIEIKPLQPVDQPVVVKWLHEYLQDHLTWWSDVLNLGWSEADVVRHIDKNSLAVKTWDKMRDAATLSRALVLTIRERSQAIGIIHASVELDDLLGYQIGHIHWIFIEAGKRRQGYGRVLMQTAQQWLLKKKPIGIELSVNRINSSARAFYEKLGYQVSDQRMLLSSFPRLRKS